MRFAYRWNRKHHPGVSNEMSGSIFCRTGSILAGVVAGLGWDVDHPPRPWIWITHRPTPKGHPALCVSCCGMFATFVWIDHTTPGGRRRRLERLYAPVKVK